MFNKLLPSVFEERLAHQLAPLSRRGRRAFLRDLLHRGPGAVATKYYESPTAQNTNRGPSPSIWGDAPVIGVNEDPSLGMYFWDDFNYWPNWGLFNGERQIGQWDVWIGNNANAIIGDTADLTNLPQEGGILGLYGGTTAIDVSMQAGGGSYRLVSPASGFPFTQKCWFESRIAISTVSTGNLDLFVGLMENGIAAGTRVTSAASLVFSATDTIKTATGMGACLGFWKRAVTNPTDVCVVYNVTNGTAKTPGTTSTLNKILTNSGVTALTSGMTAMAVTNNIPSANVWVKFGFIYDPTPSCPQLQATSAVTTNQTVGTTYSARVRFFLNGQLLPWFLNSADVQASTFPAAFMCPTIGYRSGGTAAGIGYVDWIRVLQLANS